MSDPLPTKPVKLFYSYSHMDEKLREKLETHLTSLNRQGVIAGWHYHKITAGQEWVDQIDEHLNTVQIILLLVSADFLASDYCYDKEMNRAMERHEAGEARVIPVILRPCDWHSAPFGKLLALPKDGKPIADWPSRDAAFLDVAKGIRRAAEGILAIYGDATAHEASAGQEDPLGKAEDKVLPSLDMTATLAIEPLPVDATVHLGKQQQTDAPTPIRSVSQPEVAPCSAVPADMGRRRVITRLVVAGVGLAGILLFIVLHSSARHRNDGKPVAPSSGGSGSVSSASGTGGFSSSSPPGSSDIFQAIYSSNVGKVRSLLNANVPVDTENSDNETALIVAISNAKLDIVKVLLDNKASVNAKDKEGRTALILATSLNNSAQCNNIVMVDYLLERDADVNATDKDGQTALIVAAKQAQLDIVKALVQHHADITKQNHQGQVARELVPKNADNYENYQQLLKR